MIRKTDGKLSFFLYSEIKY